VAGLSPAEMSLLLSVFQKYPSLEKAVLFGSRSTGKHKPDSDVDLVLYGENANFGTLFDISAMSFHRLMQTLMKKDAMNEWGSIVGLSYIAAQRTFPDYGEMADAKSLLESFARSFGYHYGKKKHVRVNTISQSPTKTTAGSGVGGFDAFYNYANKMSPLGNASAEACAEYCVSLFSDYTRMVTMQNLFHDGGFSFTGISSDLMDSFRDAAE